MNSGIYCIKNTMTGSCYVGSAVNIPGRWRSHLHNLRHHKKSPPKLQRAWDKYSELAFEFVVLESCPKDQLLDREQHHIDLLKPRYNTRIQAHSNIGVKWSHEQNMAKGRPNATVEYQGQLWGWTELSRHLGLPKHTIRNRLRRGWTVEQAAVTPVMTAREKGLSRKSGIGNTKSLTAFGVTASLKELVAKFSTVSYAAVVRRRCLGWGLEKALSEGKLRGN